jgi:putative transcriptional regulator
MILKTRIKEFRVRLNMTQEDLARQVHSRRETLVYLEKGRYNPSLKLAFDVARALGTTVDELFTYEDE